MNRSATLPMDETPQESIAKVQDENSGLVLMFERLAKDKDVDAGKLRELVDLQERILDRNAKTAFNEAFQRMQAEIPEIDEKGAIKNKDGGVQSRYSRFEDIQKVLKPILTKHGFALSFRSEWPQPNIVKVVGILTHQDGHARESEFMSAADTSGSKNAIQGLGSAVAYGRRYTTIDLLNITTRGKDDDGQSTGKPEPPEGYDTWAAALEDEAKNGNEAYTAAWTAKGSKAEWKTFMANFDKDRWNAIKASAQSAGKGRR